MSGTVTNIDEMTLSGTKGKITITTIAEPYGKKVRVWQVSGFH
jgi:hypothetical protein